MHANADLFCNRPFKALLRNGGKIFAVYSEMGKTSKMAGLGWVMRSDQAGLASNGCEPSRFDGPLPLSGAYHQRYGPFQNSQSL